MSKTKTNNETRILEAYDVPHEEGITVRVRDSHHEGTLVYNLGDEFVFVDLVSDTVARAERCVLVILGETPEPDGYEEIVHDWWLQLLPADCPVAMDLDGPGELLLGVDKGYELPAELGEIVWDSEQ